MTKGWVDLGWVSEWMMAMTRCSDHDSGSDSDKWTRANVKIRNRCRDATHQCQGDEAESISLYPHHFPTASTTNDDIIVVGQH